MTAPRSILIKNGTRKPKSYYLYEIYPSKEEAKKEARHQKKRNKSRYFILRTEPHGLTSYILATDSYALYLDKVIKLW